MRSREPLIRILPALLAAGLAVGFFSACQKKPAPAPAAAPAAPAPVKAAPAPAPAGSAVKVVEFAYSPGKARDPFVSLIKVKKASKLLDQAKLTPLQRFEIAQLQLKAIMIMGKKAAAQVVAPDGKAYTLRVGTLVGPGGARVRRITSESVILVEEYEDFMGRKLQQETVIPLHKKEGENPS